MFRDIIDPPARVGSRKSLTVPLSIAAHVALAALVLLIPLLAPSVLPEPRAALLAYVARDITLPEAPPPPRPRSAPAQPEPRATVAAIPLEAPDAIAPEQPFTTFADPAGSVDGTANLPDSIAGDVTVLEPPPPLPAVPAAPQREGGSIRRPVKIRDVTPMYPAMARAARVEGIVIIETTIDPTGRVIDTRLLRSIPLLDAAALEAVRQWEYTPTLLNGVPIAVIMTVTVHFTLD